MGTKRIKRVVHSQLINMDGHMLYQPLPAVGLEMLDPFLLIHYGGSELPGGQRESEVGIGPHPHRGFSPVSFIFKGAIHHRDSRGNDQVVEAGGTQWMSAGMGIVHSERPAKDFAAAGGEMEMMQIWVNTPSAFKMEQPYYMPLHAKDTPIAEREGVKIAIVSGSLDGLTSPIKQQSPLLMLRIEMKKGAKTNFEIPAGFNSLVFVQDNGLKVGEEILDSKQMAVFSEEGSTIDLDATEDLRFVLLAGAPLNEKVEKSGPFVMNSQTELMEAMRDYQMGKMGVLIEEFD